MPGNENNPSLQDAGTSAGAGGNNLPPSSRSTAAWRESPISHSTGSSKPPYNTNGGPATAGERGDARNGAESDRKVQNGGKRRSSVQRTQNPFAPISSNRMSGNKDKHLLKYLFGAWFRV